MFDLTTLEPLTLPTAVRRFPPREAGACTAVVATPDTAARRLLAYPGPPAPAPDLESSGGSLAAAVSGAAAAVGQLVAGDEPQPASAAAGVLVLEDLEASQVFAPLAAHTAAVRASGATLSLPFCTVIGCHWRPLLRDLQSDLAVIAVIFCRNGSVAPG